MRAIVLTIAFILGLTGPAAAEDDGMVILHSRGVVFGDLETAQKGLKFLGERGKLDIVPGLIMALRYRRGLDKDINAVLTRLTGHKAEKWHEWMLWQEAHPEIKPHAGYLDIKRDGLGQLDPRYRIFFRIGYDQPDDMRIRLEEIVWGGPRALDGIPSLDFPTMISVADARYMQDDDLVFGVVINGDVRAYPLRILGWHEMFNDVVGGVPVALAYCTLCGSGILYETELAGRAKPFVFGSSGMLYRSNKLMFDWETYSLWNQFTGEPVVGPLAKSGIVLKTRPVAITSWQDWKTRHPKTRILSVDTGYDRDYGSGQVYKEYFSSPDLMFPTNVRKRAGFTQKDYVFGIRTTGAAKAWPLSAFKDRRVINDAIGGRAIVLIGDAATRTVRAYERKDRQFSDLKDGKLVDAAGGGWTLTEADLRGPDGQRLPRIAGTLSYWFAWDGYLGHRSEYYEEGK